MCSNLDLKKLKKNDTNTPEILSLVFLGLYYFL